jgi:hypothetical protein
MLKIIPPMTRKILSIPMREILDLDFLFGDIENIQREECENYILFTNIRKSIHTKSHSIQEGDFVVESL